MTSEHLLPCPFCGGEGETLHVPAPNFPSVRIKCGDCGAYGPWGENGKEAVENWSTRATWLDWIECSEKRPECGKFYYILTNSKEQFVAYFNTDGYWELNNTTYSYFLIKNVTHWAELSFPKDN